MPIRRASLEANVELTDISRYPIERARSMAPDGGSPPAGDRSQDDEEMTDDTASTVSDNDVPDASEQAEQGQHFTFRGVVLGIFIGLIITCANMYFGLQTGWVSGMTMPSALLAFSFFRTANRCIDYPFTPVENVLVQTVAGSMGTMPLGCGFVGILPALNYLLAPDENGPLLLSTGRLMVFALGICFFGVAFGWILRKQVLIREKLKFPSGTATALLIGVLHGNQEEDGKKKPHTALEIFRQRSQDGRRSLSMDRIPTASGGGNLPVAPRDYTEVQSSGEEDHRDDWKVQIRLLTKSFIASAIYVKILVLPTSSSMLTLLDPHVILHSTLAKSSNLWPSSRE